MAAKTADKSKTNNKDDAPVSDQKFTPAFSLFGPSWDAVKLNFGTFLLLLILFMASAAAAVILCLVVVGIFKDNDVIMIPLLVLVGLALAAACWLIAPAGLYVQLKSAQGTQVDTETALRQGKRYFWRFFGLSILVGLIIVGGLILLIVPGLFMIKRYLLAPYYLVDKDLPIGEAMRASAEAGKRYAGAIWGVLGVEVVISLASIIPFIGSIINLVLSIAYYCALAVRYEEVKAAS